jgi:hypothetical protein
MEAENLVANETPDVIQTTRRETEIEELYYEILRKSKRRGCGQYQFLVSTYILLGLLSLGYVEYGIIYFELMPQLDCEIDGAW